MDDREPETVLTKVPEEWLSVNRETGEAWENIDGLWRRAKVNVLVLPQIPPIGRAS